MTPHAKVQHGHESTRRESGGDAMDAREIRSSPRQSYTARLAVLVTAAAVAGGAVVAGVSLLVPARYESVAVAQVAFNGVSQASPISQSVLASNDLAAQYAQAINAAPDNATVATASSVTATVLAGQNLIQIAGRADDAANAKRGAEAAITQLQQDLRKQTADTAAQAAARLEQLTAPLDADIESARDRLSEASARARAAGAEPGSAEYLELTSASEELSALRNQRSVLQSQVASSSPVVAPTIQVLRPASDAQRVSPRPLLYGVVGGLLVGLATGIMVRRRSGRSR